MPVGLGPLETIVNVGWGTKLITVDVIGRCEALSQSLALPTVPPLDATIEVVSYKTFDPLVAQNDPRQTVTPIVRPFTAAMFAAYNAWTIDQQEVRDDTVTPAVDSFAVAYPSIVVILPEPVPNPFADEAAAQSWIAGFRSRWPGYVGVPFDIFTIPAGGASTYSIIESQGTLGLNGGKLSALLHGAKAARVIVECKTNVTATYRVRTFKGPVKVIETPAFLVAEQEVQVGRFVENDVKLFRALRVTFEIDLKTLQVSNDSAAPTPAPGV